jgi:amino acid transporter
VSNNSSLNGQHRPTSTIPIGQPDVTRTSALNHAYNNQHINITGPQGQADIPPADKSSLDTSEHSSPEASAIEESEPPEPPSRPGETEELHHLHFEAPALSTKPVSLGAKAKHFFFGNPIPTSAAGTHLIGKFKALAILSSDALSSVAYGTEAGLVVLATAGLAMLSHNLVMGVAVALLLAVVAFSYRQTIYHYPKGGGSYIVASDNLGHRAGLVAAAALLIDYILTVSVSVSSGLDALLSAFPNPPAPISFLGLTLSLKVVLGVLVIGLIMWINLRGVKDTGSVFALPTYIFIGLFLFMIIAGVITAITHGGLTAAVNPTTRPPTDIPVTEQFSFFLLLTAFASGCSALTGVEAISDGVPIFKPRQERNAAQTLLIMATLLGTMYLGTTYLAWRFGVVPNLESNPTVIAQLASIFFSGPMHIIFFLLQGATTMILFLAANTSFQDFPRLSFFLARDGYMPHSFRFQGERLAFNTGIILLSILSAILLVAFGGRVTALINLYAIGVFCAFTLSQAGMVKRWWSRKEPGWQRGIIISGLGAVATGVVMLVIAITKFMHGGFLVVILIPILYFIFSRIHKHYNEFGTTMKKLLSVKRINLEHHAVIVPIAEFNMIALRGLTFALSMSPNVIGVHVRPDDKGEGYDTWAEKQWDALFALAKDYAPPRNNAPETLYLHISSETGNRMTTPGNEVQKKFTCPELLIIGSPYRAITGPLIELIDNLKASNDKVLFTVVLPEFVVKSPLDLALHNQTALRLKWALLRRPGIVTASVPYMFTSDVLTSDDATSEGQAAMIGTAMQEE